MATSSSKPTKDTKPAAGDTGKSTAKPNTEPGGPGGVTLQNAAAPLTAPTRRGPEGTPMAQHVAVGAVLDERHIGIVDEDGNPVDLAEALQRDSAVGSVRRATRRIYEETTLPGTDRTRRKLLFGENATVTEAAYEQLCAAVDATTADRANRDKPTQP